MTPNNTQPKNKQYTEFEKYLLKSVANMKRPETVNNIICDNPKEIDNTNVPSYFEKSMTYTKKNEQDDKDLEIL